MAISNVYAVVVCPSVRLSVCSFICPSHAGIVPKWLNVYRITQTTSYDSARTLVSDAKNLGEIPPYSPTNGAPNKNGVG